MKLKSYLYSSRALLASIEMRRLSDVKRRSILEDKISYEKLVLPFIIFVKFSFIRGSSNEVNEETNLASRSSSNLERKTSKRKSIKKLWKKIRNKNPKEKVEEKVLIELIILCNDNQ